ncbi:hypothetical protein FLACHUCJ7_00898 [Flavobacterium chungangense]|uniref:Uncharacterized protein n=1 Tax=Flavobacterium chungangense TaxID=554283 RepID=A0A6V6YRX2_9FLAO|nr:hypothetical protein FLACHUCJ7_00898 [Flavobacterium chungangense]
MKFHKFTDYNPNCCPVKKVYRLIFVKLFNNYKKVKFKLNFWKFALSLSFRRRRNHTRNSIIKIANLCRILDVISPSGRNDKIINKITPFSESLFQRFRLSNLQRNSILILSLLVSHSFFRKPYHNSLQTLSRFRHR